MRSTTATSVSACVPVAYGPFCSAHTGNHHHPGPHATVSISARQKNWGRYETNLHFTVRHRASPRLAHSSSATDTGDRPHAPCHHGAHRHRGPPNCGFPPLPCLPLSSSPTTSNPRRARPVRAGGRGARIDGNGYIPDG
jgi:hypothetical protein